MSGFEPFYFCECAEITAPLGPEVSTLAEFRRGLEGLSHASLYYHFLISRLRLQLNTNDFSQWLEKGLGREDLARRINRIDIYTNTLDTRAGKDDADHRHWSQTMTATEPEIAEGGLSLDQYVPLLGNEIEELRALARPLAGREVRMVNSTRVGRRRRRTFESHRAPAGRAGLAAGLGSDRRGEGFLRSYQSLS